jgi:hypothetical protein
MPSAFFDDFSSDLAPSKSRLAFERRADKALAAYFACPPANRTTRAHTTVAALLATLKPHRRAALAMAYTPRTWPQALAARCGSDTSLVVRLYCSDHPTVGRAEEIEAAAAEHLAAQVTAGKADVVNLLQARALDHFFAAEAAFRKAFEAHLSAAR